MLIGTLSLRKLYQVFFLQNSVMSFSLTKINQILLDCDLVDVYRIKFVVMCFPNMLGKRVLVTERNGPRTESKRGKSWPNHRKPWDMRQQREQDGSISNSALEYSWKPSLVWQWLRPNRAYSVYIPPALPWGVGQEEEREGSKGWLMAFEKLFPARGRCGHYTHLQLTKPSRRWSRLKLCHPFGVTATLSRKYFSCFSVGNRNLSRRSSLSLFQFVLL